MRILSNNKHGKSMENLTLAVLLSSRLCHDLVSPVGAIHNGLEIIEDEADKEMIEHAQSLIKQSALSASSRLQFYRIAFGAAGSLNEVVPLSEVYSLSKKLTDGHKIDINWQCASGAELQKDYVRLLLNFILIASEVLPRGGVIYIKVDTNENSGVHLCVQAEGPKMVISERTIEILTKGYNIENLEPRESNLYLTNRLACSLDTKVTCAKQDSQVSISAQIKL